MPYKRPGFWIRNIFNPIAMRFGISPTLVVKGRTSGEPRSVPISPVEVDGARYLRSPRRSTHWVRNLAVAGEGELRHKGNVERFRAHDVPVEEREPSINAYREIVSKSIGAMFDSIPDVADHSTFRIELI